jgi:inorganic triphosphatase YgiF
MRKEIELKFEVTRRDLRKLRAARVLRRKPLTEENLVSVYFDTPKHTLARNDVTLRVRHNGDNRLQTIKSGGLAPLDEANGSTRLRVMCPIFARRRTQRLSHY